MKPAINIFWFRRDLRLHDNAGLFHALKGGLPVLPLFIFDRNILDELEDKKDRRLNFIYQALQAMKAELNSLGSDLEIRYGFPAAVFMELMKEYRITHVFCNHDYEPYARKRDEEISTLLAGQGSGFHGFRDQVIFEKNEVVRDNGAPYSIFTPYSRKWKKMLDETRLRPFPCHRYFQGFLQRKPKKMISLDEIGFSAMAYSFPPATWHRELLRDYDRLRDYPAENGTTRLSVHLRFGSISIRALLKDALSLNPVFLNELIWREFYQMILWHFPQVVDHAFKPEYDRIRWRNNEQEFQAWCNGLTGYPIVDAGMRELNETGFMHNRLRMIVASFLSKHLLVDWRRGEAYFAKKLLDYDLAANNGGWQWAAGSGCDAAPYFRIFNPYLQAKKFDPLSAYTRKWVPEMDLPGYPSPIVDHAFARERCLQVYKKALKK